MAENNRLLQERDNIFRDTDLEDPGLDAELEKIENEIKAEQDASLAVEDENKLNFGKTPAVKSMLKSGLLSTIREQAEDPFSTNKKALLLEESLPLKKSEQPQLMNFFQRTLLAKPAEPKFRSNSPLEANQTNPFLQNPSSTEVSTSKQLDRILNLQETPGTKDSFFMKEFLLGHPREHQEPPKP